MGPGNLKPFLEYFSSRFNSLGTKEKRLAVLFFFILFFTLYVNAFLKPVANQIGIFEKQEKDNKNRLQLLVSKSPDVEKARIELENTEKSADKAKLMTKEIEESLLTSEQVPKLLNEIIARAGDLSLEFQSIKQKIDSGKDGGSWLFIEAQFDSSYSDAVSYTGKVEAISPFVKVDEIEITQSKKDPINLITETLKLSALVSENPNANNEFRLISAAEQKISELRNPFKASFIVVQGRKKTLKLSGITMGRRGASPTAIINDTVVRPGDIIEGQRVERIDNDFVTINDGSGSYPITIER